MEHLHQEYGVAGAVTVHEPDRGGDGRNFHAHITISDREVNEQGEFGKKVRLLTDMKTRNVELEKIKENWNAQCNIALEKEGHAPVKEKSAVPGVHLGKEATEMIRKKKGYKIETEEWNEACKDLSNEPELLNQLSETEEEKVKRLIGDVPTTQKKENDTKQLPKEEAKLINEKGQLHDSRNRSHEEAGRSEVLEDQGNGEEGRSREGSEIDGTKAQRIRGERLERLLRKVTNAHRTSNDRNKQHERTSERNDLVSAGEALSGFRRYELEDRIKRSKTSEQEKLMEGFKKFLPEKAKTYLSDLPALFKGKVSKIYERFEKARTRSMRSNSRGNEHEGR